MTGPPEALDRRAFLRRSLVTGALAATPSLAGCGAAPGMVGAADGRALLERLERGLGRVRDVPRGRVARELRGMARPQLAEDVLRHTLESFVIADVAQSVHRAPRLPAALEARLRRELPVLARTSDVHQALLRSMPPRARRGLDAELRADPSLPSDVAAWVDAHAAELGTSHAGRAKLRLAVRDVDARMRRQSASAVIDDCVGKVEQVSARAGLQATPSAGALMSAIWNQIEGAGHGLTAPGRAPPLPLPDPDVEWAQFLDDHDRIWSARWASPGDEEVKIGAILMPFGAITCGLLLIVGLIVLVAGAIQNATWDGSPRFDP